MRPCLGCGDLATESRCDECRVEHERPARRAYDRTRDRLSPKVRGYDSAWQRLSKRARALQPFCLDCGSTSDLSVDHLPSAWGRMAEGKPVRLRDVEVVCRDCNTRRGSSRPGTARAAA